MVLQGFCVFVEVGLLFPDLGLNLLCYKQCKRIEKTLHAPFTAHKPVLVKKQRAVRICILQIMCTVSRVTTLWGNQVGVLDPPSSGDFFISQHPENEKERNVFCVILISVHTQFKKHIS